MNENLNLVEILKDCPQGTKLYSTIFGWVDFEYIENEEITVTNNTSGDTETFNQNGSWYYGYTNECMLFPSKDQRDWSKFKVEPEMVEGEFYYCLSNLTGYSFIFIYKKHMSYKTKHYAAFNITSSILFKDDDIVTNNENIAELRKATEEEKQQLLDAIKVRNYEWDFVKKELIKIEPKFDITTFKPFDKVLVRDGNINTWHCSFFDRLDKTSWYSFFFCVGGRFHQCIPYNNETKHLHDTNEIPPKKYITWEE